MTELQPRTDPATTAPEPVHTGWSCNSCHQYPISGVRYHCANCPDYDLCPACEALDLHDPTHLFLKIRRPLPPPLFTPTSPLLPILYS